MPDVIINDALKGKVAVDTSVTVKGWVRTRRDSKGGFSFVAVNDGSCFDSIQAVCPNTLANYATEVAKLTAGCAVEITGKLVKSQGKGQAYEIQADAVTVVGWVEDPETYPVQPKQHTMEYLREVAHLRPRTNTFGAVTRVRNTLAAAVHRFFQERGFFWIHTPIITTSDAEGAGAMFRVSTLDLQNLPRTPEGQVDYAKDFFGKAASLTVSGQLNVETYAMAMSRVYTFGPTFRAENSNTTRHLAEFWMIEPEIAFADLKTDADLAEAFLKYIFRAVLDERQDDMKFFVERIDKEDVTLTGQNFVTRNPLAPDRPDATTGAYVPFGTATQPGHVVKGQMPCNGAILKVPLDPNVASKHPEPILVAWGLRNPFALAFAPDGRLFCAENSYDVRGSRPVYGTGDVLWHIVGPAPLWYGWPDFHAGRPLTWSDHFQAPGQPAPQFLLAEHPNPPPKPAAILPVHGAYGGFDFSRRDAAEGFGFPGQLFIAAFGDMAPAVGKVLAPVGFRVDRVDPNTGVIEAFAVNRGKENGPASKLQTGGLERPLAARFDNHQAALYVVDFGVLTMDGKTPKPREKTGVLWRITREGAR